ncbi:hypothetical protein TNCV_3350301 [Trichonephila clavipes]|nr:hypothetical protein TNCV_3350301 [Trichonephila clavipes]
MLPSSGIMGNEFSDTLAKASSDLLQPDSPVCYIRFKRINARFKTCFREKMWDSEKGKNLSSLLKSPNHSDQPRPINVANF